MKPTLHVVTIVFFVLGLSGCGESGGGAASESSAEAFNLAGSWEGEFPDRSDATGTGKGKGRVTLSGNDYTYSWYKKLIGPDNSVIYDWTETARETGSISVSPDYMEWTAKSFGEAQYNQSNHTWTGVEMKSSKSDYAIQYRLEGDKLTLMEDINLDGDFDDVFETPETLIYTKVK